MLQLSCVSRNESVAVIDRRVGLSGCNETTHAWQAGASSQRLVPVHRRGRLVLSTATAACASRISRGVVWSQRQPATPFGVLAEAPPWLHPGDVRVLSQHHSVLRQFVRRLCDANPLGLLVRAHSCFCLPPCRRRVDTPRFALAHDESSRDSWPHRQRLEVKYRYPLSHLRPADVIKEVCKFFEALSVAAYANPCGLLCWSRSSSLKFLPVFPP